MGQVGGTANEVTAAVTAKRGAYVECVVDDPLIALGGYEAQGTRVLAVIVVLWLALGYSLSWKKGVRGRKVTWIGAQLSDWKSNGAAPGVTVTISPEKIHKVKEDCQRLLRADPLYAHDLRTFTGLVT